MTAASTPSPQRAGTDASVLAIDGLRCRYGPHEAVRGIDLAVEPAEVFALLGTNGAGKTTTLETIEGLRHPDGGRVRLLGLDPARQRRRLAARVGVMFQEPSTPDELTPAESLALWARLHGRREPRVGAHLDRVDLAHRRDVRAGQLSGGERRRLDLALAISTAPEVLLLDEPTTGLDPQSRMRTWDTIRDLAAEGVSVLFTTHYLEEAEALADHLAIMHAGEIAVRGTVEEVRAAQPARIRCLIPPGHAGVTLPNLSGTVGRASDHRGERLTVATDRLQRDLTTLLDWAEQHGVALDGLQASEPTLAEVFHGIHTEEEIR